MDKNERRRGRLEKRGPKGRRQGKETLANGLKGERWRGEEKVEREGKEKWGRGAKEEREGKGRHEVGGGGGGEGKGALTPRAVCALPAVQALALSVAQAREVSVGVVSGAAEGGAGVAVVVLVAHGAVRVTHQAALAHFSSVSLQPHLSNIRSAIPVPAGQRNKIPAILLNHFNLHFTIYSETCYFF